MSQNKRRNDFVKQAGILAGAGIIVRIIGILYRSPLTSIIGDEGNGYYGAAYNIYTIILLLSSYSIPSAISKVIAQKMAVGEYRNAHRIFRNAFLYVCVVGGAASLLTFLLAGVLVDQNAVPVLRIFTPTIFLSGILGVLRGYFQAHRTMVQTSMSQILEQILNAVVSILAAWLLVRGAEGTERAVRGAMGSAMGTGAGVLMALLFMALLYRVNRRYFHRRLARDTGHELMSRKEILRLIVLIVTPFILSTFIYNLSTPLDQTIYINILKGVKGLSSSEAATQYGIYSGKTMVIINIPIAIAAAVSSAIIPAISGAYAKGDLDDTREKVATGIQTTMVIAIPAAVGLGVLAKPVTQLLFPQPGSLEAASALLRALAVSVVFYSLSTLTNAVLQAVGEVNKPVFHAAVALVLQTVVLVPMLLYTEANLYSMVLATVVYSFSMCVLNQISVRRSLAYRQEYMRTFILPALSAGIMGAFAWAAYEIVIMIIPVNAVALAVSILVAVAVYFSLVLKTGAMGREELTHVPKGAAIARLAEKLHLLRD